MAIQGMNPELAPGAFETPEDPLKDDRALIEKLRALERARSGYFAVHVNLSQLKSGNRKPHFMRIASRSFETLAMGKDVARYSLSNFDVALICKDVPVDDVDNAVYKVRALFSEDPLTTAEEGSLDDRFATWYDLAIADDYQSYVDTCQQILTESEKQLKKRRDNPEGGQHMVGERLSPHNLVKIRETLAKARINDLIQQQSAVQVKRGGKADVLFREHYVSMSDLQKRVAPDVNLFGSAWLFQFLTETIDRRMLTIMARQDYESLPDAISLNMNISTVMSRDFQEFHRWVEKHTDKMVIELQMIDIFADMGGYQFARDMLREKGYRVLADGLTPLHIQFFDPGVLHADFVKVNWGREFSGEVGAQRLAEMRDVVNHSGKESVILARVDSEDAVKWGLNIGVSRFQGHFVDTLVARMATKGDLA